MVFRSALSCLTGDCNCGSAWQLPQRICIIQQSGGVRATGEGARCRGFGV